MTDLKSAALFGASLALLVPSNGPVRAAPDNTLGMALLSARVAIGGQLLHGSGAVSAEMTGTGVYAVIFDRDVSDCYISATILDTNVLPFGTITAAVSTATPARLAVRTMNSDAQNTARPFNVIVFCAR